MKHVFTQKEQAAFIIFAIYYTVIVRPMILIRAKAFVYKIIININNVKIDYQFSDVILHYQLRKTVAKPNSNRRVI